MAKEKKKKKCWSMQQKNCSEIVPRESEFQRGQTNKMAPSVHSDESIEASSNFFLFKFNLQNLGISKEKSSMQSFTCLLQNLQEPMEQKKLELKERFGCSDPINMTKLENYVRKDG